MEKTRVPKGKKYWYLYLGSRNVVAVEKVDYHNSTDDDYFLSGNYFHTEKEAEAMAEKLRAVLAGADVIEMPSDEEMRLELEDSREMGGYSEDTWTENAYEDGFINGFIWMKSKIVK